MKNVLFIALCLLTMSVWYYQTYYIDIKKLPCNNCIIQDKRMNCGPAALKMVFQDFNIHLALSEIEKETNFNKSEGVSLLDLFNYCEKMGLQPRGLRLNEASLKAYTPAIIFIKQSHFVVLDSLDTQNYCYIRDPARGRMKIPINHLSKMWNGEILLFQK